MRIVAIVKVLIIVSCERSLTSVIIDIQDSRIHIKFGISINDRSIHRPDRIVDQGRNRRLIRFGLGNRRPRIPDGIVDGVVARVGCGTPDLLGGIRSVCWNDSGRNTGRRSRATASHSIIDFEVVAKTSISTSISINASPPPPLFGSRSLQNLTQMLLVNSRDIIISITKIIIVINIVHIIPLVQRSSIRRKGIGNGIRYFFPIFLVLLKEQLHLRRLRVVIITPRTRSLRRRRDRARGIAHGTAPLLPVVTSQTPPPEIVRQTRQRRRRRRFHGTGAHHARRPDATRDGRRWRLKRQGRSTYYWEEEEEGRQRGEFGGRGGA
mmetsp:Transcript_15017/g.29703  ORF Transcript_15017/g.29703 Transcript_15017/m.29703 type:complete len:323 (-) Transcript_15017:311-1279(-)